MSTENVSADIHLSLELGLVAVLVGQRPCGGGLLVDKDHIVTCAHVVNTALARRPDDRRIPTSIITVMFPYIGEVARPCEIAAWHPVGDPNGDIAVLRLLDGAPVGSRPVDIVVGASLEGHRFMVWGFPQGRSGQMLAEGRLSRRRGDSRIQIDGLAETGQPVREGFSGAPVWDCVLGGVIGMVQSRDPDATTRTAFLMPADIIALAWPTLPTRTPLRPGSGNDLVRVAGDRVSASVEFWRNRDLARSKLRQMLLSGTRIISVTGRRGIGKSAIVAKVLADFEQRDHSRSPLDDLDALAYLSTRTGSGALTLARIFDTVASLASAEDQHRLARRWENVGRDALPALWEAFRDRRLVVVLDNLDDLQDPNTGKLLDDDVAAFLASACRTPYAQHVVTTSIVPLRLSSELLTHVSALELHDGLPLKDAIEVLRWLSRTGSAGLEELTDDQLAIAASRVHCIPRGLELLAQLLNDDPFATEDLINSEMVSEVLLVELVSRAYTRLTTSGRDVVGVLALASVPLPLEALSSVLDDMVLDSDIVATVRQLVRDRELGFDRSSRLFHLHPLDADFIRHELMSSEPDRQSALDCRLAQWYATQRTPPWTWRQLDDAAPNKWEFTHRWRAGDHESALAALADAAEFLARRGETSVLRAAVRNTKPQAVTPTAVVHVHFCLAMAELFDGSVEVAEEALREARAVARDDSQARGFLNRIDYWLGTVLRHRCECAEAADIQRQLAFNPDPAISPVLRRRALFELGLSLCYLRDLTGARVALERLKATNAPQDPFVDRAQVSDVTALINLLAGDHKAVLQATTDGIAAYAESAWADDAGYLYNVRALAQLGANDLTAAETDLEHALAMAQDFAADRLVGLVATNLAWLRLRQRRYKKAVTAAQLGAQRLGTNKVKEVASARALATLLSDITNITEAEAHRELVNLAQLALNNPDLYQPTAEVLDQLATELAEQSSRA